MLQNVLSSQFHISVDLIIVIFLIVIFLVGLKRGFVDQILSLVGTVFSFVIAYALCGTLFNWLKENTQIFVNFSLAIKNAFNFPISGEVFATEIELALSNSFYPEFLKTAISNHALSLGQNVVEGSTVIAQTIAKYLLTGACYLVILFAVKILCKILKKILLFINDVPIVGLANRILGGIASIFTTIICIYGLIFFLQLLPFIPAESLNKLFSYSVILQFLAKYNLFAWFFALII